MPWIYLDNNATTRPAEEVAAAVAEANAELWANASSAHRFGQQVRQRVELARASVAKLIAAKPRELIFTSGGTESNNLALWGLLDPALRSAGQRRAVLITSPVEHAAVREPASQIGQVGGMLQQVKVDRAGRVDVGSLVSLLDGCCTEPGVVVVSLQWANNETGVIQPVEQIAAVVAEAKQIARDAGGQARVYLHIDATQAVGKVKVDAPGSGADLLTLSAHKFHGPKGVGALWLRTGVRPATQQRGGPQERGQRGGTENAAGIIGLGVAAELAGAFLADTRLADDCRALRDRFEQQVRQALPDVVVNSGPPAPRLWNTSNLAFPGLEAEAILLGLSERGVCASAGAACSSGSLEPSPVLLAMGLPEPVAHGSVRFSLSRYTAAHEIDAAMPAIVEVVTRLASVMPR